MSKKLTTNTFGKGMMLDLHPLTVPNDVLTDALNATTITMNGNEGILQNDMGNGRVESAFLPPGYVPVGIKEYGGIIYVASYNPITNKSLIGSFPSPERNIDQTEYGSLLNPLQLLKGNYKRNYKFSGFNTDEYTLGLGGFTAKTEIFGDYKVLRSGDKFGFYFDGNNNTTLLSNYFWFAHPERKWNWDNNNKVYQNNIITLSTQVLDSNNNLRDLTKLLKRYDDNNKVIKFDKSDITEDDKFNAGYFIRNPLADGENPVNEERNKSALNTYNNKLFGRLYLVGLVNVIDHIDVLLVTKSYTTKDLDLYFKLLGKNINKVLYFYIDYYFNCPENYLYEPKVILHYDENVSIIKAKPRPYLKDVTTVTNKKYYKKLNGSYLEITLESEIYNDIVNIFNNKPGLTEIDPNVNPIGPLHSPALASASELYPVESVMERIETYNDLEIKEIITKTTTYKFNEEDITYDSLTNLYKKRYLVQFILDENTYPIEGVDNTILNYIVIPQMYDIPGEVSDEGKTDNEKNGNYLEESTNKIISQLTHIATEGSIDLSKIGSGECNITIWRYICTDDMIKLNWGLEDYPLDTDVITDMRMDFYDWNNITSSVTNNIPNWYITFNQISYNSVNTSITLGNNTLKKRHIYLVKLSRTKNENPEVIGWRILITTSIYNDLFMIHDDYCSTEAKNSILERNTIKVNFDINENNINVSKTNYDNNLTYFRVNIPNKILINNIYYYYFKDLNSVELEEGYTNPPETKTIYYYANGDKGYKNNDIMYEIDNNYNETLTALTTDCGEVPIKITYYNWSKVVDNTTTYLFDGSNGNPDDIILYYESSNKFSPVVDNENIINNNYSYILYSSIDVSRLIDIDLNILNKFPFEINDKSALNYNININYNYEHDALLNKVGYDELSVFEKESEINLLNIYKSDLIPDIKYEGDNTINFTTHYNFPSQLIFNYTDNKQSIPVGYKYIPLHDYIYSKLPNKVLVPLVGRNLENNDDELYIYYAIFNRESSNFEEITDSNKIYLEENDNIHKEKFSTYKTKIETFLNNNGFFNENFILIGSPLTFGYNPLSSTNLTNARIKCDTIFDLNWNLAKLINGGKHYVSFMLRHPLYKGSRGIDKDYALAGEYSSDNFEDYLEDINHSHHGHKDWFMLLWKSTDSNDKSFIIINNFYLHSSIQDKTIEPCDYFEKEGKNLNYANAYYNQYITKIDKPDNNWIIKLIFGDFPDRYFYKSNESGTYLIYGIYNYTYNNDYNVSVNDIITLVNLEYNDDKKFLKYYNTNNVISQNNDIILIETPINELNEYLKFVLLKESSNKSTSIRNFKVKGMSEFISIDMLGDFNSSGLIEYNGKVYTTDENNSPLTENYYMFDSDNKLRPKSNIIDNLIKTFVNSLTQDNTNFKINASNTNVSSGTSLYAHSIRYNGYYTGVGNSITEQRFTSLIYLLGENLPFITFDNTVHRKRKLFNT